jgi:hypothetical protein
MTFRASLKSHRSSPSTKAMTLVATILYPSKEVRDVVIKTGMEHGAAESYDKLEEILASGELASPAGVL